MIKKEIILYSLRNIKQRKSRSILTIFSIFIGITAIFIFISFGLGLYQYVDSFATSTSADKLSIMPKGAGAGGLDPTFALTKDDLREVERTPGVYDATGLYSNAGEVEQKSAKKYVFFYSYDPEKPLVLELFNSKIYEGRELKKGDIGKAVVGYNYRIPDKIFPEAYQVGDTITVNGEDMRIVGFMESLGNPQDDSTIYVINDYYEDLHPNATGYGWIIARIDTSDIPGVIERVEKKLRESRNLEEGKEDFFVQSFEDMLESFTSALNIIIAFIILIALISVVVSAVNTANTMVTSVIERVKEIGVIKSIGARNSDIFIIFVFESAFLGFLAGTIGVIIGFLIVLAAGALLTSLGWGFLQPAYPWYLFVGAIIFATLTGAISGALPAKQASKIRPVDALRYE